MMSIRGDLHGLVLAGARLQVPKQGQVLINCAGVGLQRLPAQPSW